MEELEKDEDDDDDDDFTPGDLKSIGDCLVVNIIFLPNVTLSI